MMDKTFLFNPARILCGVDLSELSALALKYAAVAAKAYNATLTVLHAEHFDLPPYFTAGQVHELTRQIESERQQAEDYLRRHARTVLGGLADDIKLSFAVTEGHPVDALLQKAKEQSTGLIVVGTHGRGGAKRLWLGSVAENVMRQAEVPVFVVRQKQHEFIDTRGPEKRPELKSILCPVNFTPAAHASLQVAHSIAVRMNASLMPVCIIEEGENRTPTQAQELLRAWLSELTPSPGTQEPLAEQGHAAEQIVSLAQARKVDLIVLGARHRRSARSWLLGSTTELVVRHAPAPVLVVPMAAGEQAQAVTGKAGHGD